MTQNPPIRIKQTDLKFSIHGPSIDQKLYFSNICQHKIQKLCRRQNCHLLSIVCQQKCKAKQNPKHLQLQHQYHTENELRKIIVNKIDLNNRGISLFKKQVQMEIQLAQETLRDIKENLLRRIDTLFYEAVKSQNSIQTADCLDKFLNFDFQTLTCHEVHSIFNFKPALNRNLSQRMTEIQDSTKQEIVKLNKTLNELVLLINEGMVRNQLEFFNRKTYDSHSVEQLPKQDNKNKESNKINEQADQSLKNNQIKKSEKVRSNQIEKVVQQKNVKTRERIKENNTKYSRELTLVQKCQNYSIDRSNFKHDNTLPKNQSKQKQSSGRSQFNFTTKINTQSYQTKRKPVFKDSPQKNNVSQSNQKMNMQRQKQPQQVINQIHQNAHTTHDLKMIEETKQFENMCRQYKALKSIEKVLEHQGTTNNDVQFIFNPSLIENQILPSNEGSIFTQDKPEKNMFQSKDQTVSYKQPPNPQKDNFCNQIKKKNDTYNQKYFENGRKMVKKDNQNFETINLLNQRVNIQNKNSYLKADVQIKKPLSQQFLKSIEVNGQNSLDHHYSTYYKGSEKISQPQKSNISPVKSFPNPQIKQARTSKNSDKIMPSPSVRLVKEFSNQPQLQISPKIQSNNILFQQNQSKIQTLTNVNLKKQKTVNQRQRIIFKEKQTHLKSFLSKPSNFNSQEKTQIDLSKPLKQDSTHKSNQSIKNPVSLLQNSKSLIRTDAQPKKIQNPLFSWGRTGRLKPQFDEMYLQLFEKAQKLKKENAEKQENLNRLSLHGQISPKQINKIKLIIQSVGNM